MKACSKCGEKKDLAEFYKNTRGTDGRRGDCKACVLAARRRRYEREGDLLRSRVTAYRNADPERYREMNRARRTPALNRTHYLKRYGLSPADFDSLLERQGGRCAICREDSPGRYWCVDHDHLVGPTAVRGVLCWHCNVGLGHFRDDIVSLIAAADYLARVSTPVVP